MLTLRFPSYVLVLITVLASVLTALGVGAVGTSAAQQTEELFLDSLDVRLVLVDVVVEGPRGEPLLDLAEEDFRVLEDGVQMEIRSFTAPEGPAASSAVRKRSQEIPGLERKAPPRRTVFMIDEFHLNPNHRKRVLQHARTTIKDMMEGDDEVMLARFDGQLQIIQPFTDDRLAVLSALEAESKVRRVPIRTAWRETERTLAYLADLQEMNTDAPDRSVQGPAARPSGDDPCVQNGQVARTHAQQVHSLASQSLTGMFQLVGSLARRNGRKALVYISDGLPLTPGTAVYNFAAEMCDGTGAIAGLENGVDTSNLGGNAKNTRWDPKLAQMELAEFEMTREWRQLSALANSKEVSIYPLQAGGLSGLRSAGVDSTRVSMRTESTARVDIEDSMNLVADQTGGSVIKNTNDFDSALRGILRESGQTYRLSYAPPNPGDGREHRIAVEVERPGVRVRHRKSYLNQTAEQRMADSVIATLLHGAVDNPLNAEFEVVAGEPPKDKGAHKVKLTVALPLESLTTLVQEGVEKGQFTVLVSARESGGRFTPIGKRVFPVTLSADDPRSDDATNYVYEIALPLRGDGATVAVAVRDDVSGTVSYLKRSVQLPVS